MERSHSDYNVQDFISGKTNILFITGYSASGKSTLAKAYCKKYNATYVELDMLHGNLLESIDLNNESIKFWLGFIKYYKYGRVMDFGISKKIIANGNYNSESISKRVVNLLLYAKSLKGRYIIEGVQCYLYQETWDIITKEPIIIMNTSLKESYKSNLKRDRELNNGKRLYTYKDKIYYKQYYQRQELLLRLFKERLEDQKMNLDSILESYIIIDEHEHIDDYAMEGFFKDDDYRGEFTADRDKTLVNTYKTHKKKDLYIPVPSAIWPKAFASKKTGYASAGMIKNGIRILNEYVNTLEKVYKYAEANSDRYEKAFDAKNNEEMTSMITEFRKTASYMIATNRNVGSIFSGPQQPIPESFRKALVGPFTKFQKIYEDSVVKCGQYLAQHNSRSTVKKMFKKAPNPDERYLLYFEVVLYCKDFWTIVSRYLDTNA